MTKRRTTAAALTPAVSGGTSVHDGLENVIAGLGTSRDKLSYNQWGAIRQTGQQELENMFRSSWLAKRIVNSVADDMTREWRDANSDDGTHEAIEVVERKLRIPSKVNEALRWARLYGGSVIVIGTKNAKLDQPLDLNSVRQGDLQYLHVLDRWRVSANGALNMDFASPSFGLPDSYMMAQAGTSIHHSRVIRFNGQKLPFIAWQANAMWDDSELLHVMDSIMNLSTSTQAISTMMFEANVDVVSGANLGEMLSTKNGEEKLVKRFQSAAMMKSFNRMLLLDATETYDKKSNNFSGLNLIVQQFMVDVCGAADIPMTRLFGQSAGGLNATGAGDIRNYYDMLKAKQEAELRPQLEYLDQILYRHATGKPPPDSYEWDFRSLWQTSEKEQAEIEQIRANRDQIYMGIGVVTEGVVAAELLQAGTYKAMTEKDVSNVAELGSKIEDQ